MVSGGTAMRRPQLCGRGAAAPLLALALFVAALAPAAAVKGLSSWSAGLITHFGGAQDGMNPNNPSFGTKEGSCGYGTISKSAYPYFSTAALAPSNPFYQSDPLQGCGQCFQIQCADKRSGVCKTDSAGKPLSVMVMISDKCPECGTQHIDVQSLTFAKLADPGIGRIDMQYRRVECTPPDDMKVSVMDFRGAGGWLRLSIDDTGGRAAVKSVSVKGSSGDWKQLTHSWGATWETSSAPQPPLDFKIVGDDGEEVVAEDVVKQNGGISGGAYDKSAKFSAGVQFGITDPAANLVKAFDGASDPMLITSSTPGNDAPGSASTSSASASASSSSAGSAPASATATATSSSSQGCADVAPPGSYTCQQQKDWGKCSQGWFTSAGYCAKTCGRCSGSSTGTSTSTSTDASSGSSNTSSAGCFDVAPPGGHTCQQQKDWGKCGQSFMKSGGFCKATCGACGGGSSSSRRMLKWRRAGPA